MSVKEKTEASEQSDESAANDVDSNSENTVENAGDSTEDNAEADVADVSTSNDDTVDDGADEGSESSDKESNDPVTLLEAELAAARKLADENWDRVLRTQAEMENQRKRSQKELDNARKFALEGLINDLLPIKDSLEMGIAAAQEDDADPEKIIEGSDLTLKMLGQAFEKYHIAEVNPVDEKFNPELHQAMTMQEADGKDPNTVINVLQKGYTLNERLIRPALVVVAK